MAALAVAPVLGAEVGDERRRGGEHQADVVGAVRFFLSEDGALVTGVSLDVDGGSRLGFIPGVG